jgi:hypothetical protein
MRSAEPATTLILPELRPPRREDLKILILPDGNRRARAPAGGYVAGARKVVEIAEHLAWRTDVSTMVVCVVSPENIARRGDGFFLDLYQAFIQLGVAIETTGALVASGVRLEIHGDLGALREGRGHAAALADAIEAVTAMTARVEPCALRLLLCVGYGGDLARELDVDIVLRTGMEGDDTIRLSGLHSHPGILNHSMMKLWPDVQARDVDAVIDASKSRAAPVLSMGYGHAAVVELIAALADADLVAPVRATIMAYAPARMMIAALDRLYAGGPDDSGLPGRGPPAVAASYLGEGDTPRWYGRRDEAAHELRIISSERWAASPAGAGYASWLAPGQQGSSWTLPAWPPPLQANVHGCAPTPLGIVEGLRAAQRFLAQHPPLFGGDRALGGAGEPSDAPPGDAAPWPAYFDEMLTLVEPHRHRSVEELALVLPRRDESGERDTLADLFCAKAIRWAAAAGLMVPGPVRTAFLNYALTGFFMNFRITPAPEASLTGWEPHAELLSRCMILISAGDEGIFDLVVEGEGPRERAERLEVSAGFLQRAICADERIPGPQQVHGARLLEAIAAGWREMIVEHGPRCHPASLERWRAALCSLYGGSVAEYETSVIDNRMVLALGEGGAEGAAAAAAIEARYAVGSPPRVASRIRSLLSLMSEGAVTRASPVDPESELRVLMYLLDACGAMAAALLFRTAPLMVPAESMTPDRIASLDSVATLMDMNFRLRNDLSGFLGSASGDRDAKENACSILVPPGALGPARQAAIVRAVATCRRLASWVEDELRREVGRAAAIWPYMGVLLRRGIFVGRRVYEVGHYTTVTRAQMSAIFDEFESSAAGAHAPA